MNQTHRIHVWYIYLHEWLIFMVNVGKYTIHGSYGKQTFYFGFHWLDLKKQKTCLFRGTKRRYVLIHKNPSLPNIPPEVWCFRYVFGVQMTPPHVDGVWKPRQIDPTITKNPFGDIFADHQHRGLRDGVVKRWG